MNLRDRLKSDRATAASITEQLAALGKMTVGQLAEKHLEILGFAPRSRNGAYLRKRLAWEIQAAAEGGLSERALARIEELAPLAPVRWNPSSSPSDLARAKAASGPRPHRDPRLPPPGSVLVRFHRGVEHRVTVLEAGFEYCGQRHRSLSELARLIAGTPWNGYLFFRLQSRGRAKGQDGGRP